MVALTLANIKMMARNRQAIFWALFFPLMLVVVFGLFEVNGVGSADVGVIDQSEGPNSELLLELLNEIEFLELESDAMNVSVALDKITSSDLVQRLADVHLIRLKFQEFNFVEPF